MEPTQFINPFGQTGAVFAPVIILVIVLIAIWSYIWKGLALWRAARAGSKTWYVVLLILNTAGILDIIYYFAIGKAKSEETSKLSEQPQAPVSSSPAT